MATHSSVLAWRVPRDGGAWWEAVYGVTQSRTRLKRLSSMLCPCAMSFFKSCALPPFPPVSCSFPEPHPGPQCCLYNLLEGQPENIWPLGGKHCIISSPSRYSGLHLPRFLQHMQHQHLSVNLLGWATGTQCLLEIHLLASLQRQLGSQG